MTAYYRTLDISKSFEIGERVILKKMAGKPAKLYFHGSKKTVILNIRENQLPEKIDFSSGVLASSLEDENELFVLFDCMDSGRVIFEIKNYSVLNINNEECEGL